MLGPPNLGEGATRDLSDSEPVLKRLAVPDAEVWFARHLEWHDPADNLLAELIGSTPWRHEAVTIFGKKFMQPRLIAWIGDAGQKYSYSGVQLRPVPWSATLRQIREKIEAVSGERFNSVLLNFYRDHHDSIGLHSDDEKELGPTPTIASLSLGATRTLILKHKMRRDLKRVRLDLQSSSLLLMKGSTQTYWKHGIDKQSKPCGPRVNLTFRRIFPKETNASGRSRPHST